MHLENSIPGTCRETGLNCETCTETAAQNLARVCHGLRGKQLGQLFVQLYPHAACAPMHAHFARAYGKSDESSGAGAHKPNGRETGGCDLRAAAAVA